MSTVRLKTSHKGLGEKGDVVSVPFGKGKELVGIGAAEYTHEAAPGAPPKDSAPAPELAAAGKKIADLEAENKKLKAENAELKELTAGEPALDKKPAPAAKK